MPKILRVELTPDQDCEVCERLRARDLGPYTRLRPDCIRLIARGMTLPQVADLLEMQRRLCVVRPTASKTAVSTPWSMPHARAARPLSPARTARPFRLDHLADQRKMPATCSPAR